MIGQMKCDGLLNRNWLKGATGDALHAILCGTGHNLRMILAPREVVLHVLIALLAFAATVVSKNFSSLHRPVVAWSPENELFRAD